MPVAPVFFVDTSVYIAALLSPDGAAGALLHLVEAGAIDMVISAEVVVEADRVLSRKFPGLVQESRALLKHLAPRISPDPDPAQLTPFKDVLHPGDARILCAAYLASPQAFVTWNTRDFMVERVTALVNFPILVPSQALELFRELSG